MWVYSARGSRLALPAALLSLVLLLSACGGQTQAPPSGSTTGGSAPAQQATTEKQKVRIGLGAPITGTSAFDGQMIRDGALLAVELAKSDPRFARYDLELVIEDDKSDPKEGAAIANKFAGDESLVAVVGHYNSSVTLAAAPILGKAGIIQISPGSSSPKITGFSKYLFRTQPTDALEGSNIAQWASELGYKKAAVLYENTDYGKGLQEVYDKVWPQTGGSIVAEESYLSGQTTDFSAILTKVKESGAEVILLGSLYNESALMAKQARQFGMDVPFFGTSSMFTKALIELGKEAVEGFRVVGGMNPDSKDPNFVKFWDAFRQKYGKEPNVFAAQSYDATNIILEAVANAGPDRAKINEYILNQLKDFPGVTGKITFKDGDAQKTMFRFAVKGGVFVPVEK